MPLLVLSASLNPDSRSRILARHAHAVLHAQGPGGELVDLLDLNLPLCDGARAYGHAAVAPLAAKIRDADAVILAFPVYNYDASASAKNLIELTGKAWTAKVVALMTAAGGQGSYMAPMQIANALMLDFRSLIVPRFVYATGSAFEAGRVVDPEVARRVEELVRETAHLAARLKN